MVDLIDQGLYESEARGIVNEELYALKPEKKKDW